MIYLTWDSLRSPERLALELDNLLGDTEYKIWYSLLYNIKSKKFVIERTNPEPIWSLCPTWVEVAISGNTLSIKYTLNY